MKKKKIVVLFMICFVLAASMFFSEKGEAQAAGDYYLQVNKATNVVTVFKNDGTPVKAFVCSTGYATPIGTFYTSQKLRWHILDGPSYGQYCTRITGSILFHSVWYYRNGDYNSQSYREYNKLGTTASHGCVRLTVADAKWIYDNCPLRTKIVVIYGSAANDALGKPDAVKVNPNQSMGWDPTDPMSGNPYSTLMPSIHTDSKVKKISYKSKFKPFAGISAKDSLENDISGKITYSGKVNTKKLGSYKVTYTVTDALGRSAQAKVTYKVVDTKKAVIKGVKKTQTKEYKSTVKLKSNIKAYTVTGKNLTKKVKIKIVYPGSKKEKTYTKSTLKLTKTGTYKVNYYVTNPNNKKVTKVTSKITVKDTKNPKIYGVSSKKTVEYGSVRNLKSKVSAKLVSGKDVSSKIKIQVKGPGDTKYRTLSASGYQSYKFGKTGTYRVVYSVTNPYNKKAVAKKTTVFTVNDTKAPVISGAAKDKTVDFLTRLNLRTGVTAKLVSGTNITSGIKITVTTPDNISGVFSGQEYLFNKAGTYQVTYVAVNAKSNKAAQKSIKVQVKADARQPQIVIAEGKVSSAELKESYNVFEGVTAVLPDGTAVSGVTAQLAGVDEAGLPIGSMPVIGNDGRVIFETAGSYIITYTAINPNNPLVSATAEFMVTVTEPEEPEEPETPDTVIQQEIEEPEPAEEENISGV